MIITPGINRYEVVLAEIYYLREICESIVLSESFDEMAMRADIRMVVTPDFPGISPGQKIRISGTPPGEPNMRNLLYPGVVWEINSVNRGQKYLDVVAFDRAIYLKSEDEYILKEGKTASERLEKYANDWGIPLIKVTPTMIPLSKAVYRKQSIYSMIQRDLAETVSKGGGPYIVRMTMGGLELVEVGGNPRVWVLDFDSNIEELEQKRSLEDACTKVKVLGAKSDDTKTNVIAEVAGSIGQYGVIQKVLQESRITNAGQAQSAGQELLTTEQDMESFKMRCIDINTMRVGNRVSLAGMELIVTSIRHYLGSPGHMELELRWESTIRKIYYTERFEHNGSL